MRHDAILTDEFCSSGRINLIGQATSKRLAAINLNGIGSASLRPTRPDECAALRAVWGLRPGGFRHSEPCYRAIYPFRRPKALPKLEGKQQPTPAATRSPAFRFATFRLSCVLASHEYKVRQRRSGSALFFGDSEKGRRRIKPSSTERRNQRRGRSRAPVDLRGKDHAIFKTL